MPKISELINPLIELCLGLLNLYPKSNFISFQIHLLHIIVDISTKTHLKVPLYSHLKKLFLSHYFYKKEKGEKEKEFDFEINYKCSAKEVENSKYWSFVFDHLINLSLSQISMVKDSPLLEEYSKIFLILFKGLCKKNLNKDHKRKLVLAVM